MTHNEPLPDYPPLSPEAYKSIREVLNTIREEGLEYYKTSFRRLLQSQQPFTDSQLKSYHEHILQEIISSLESTLNNSFDHPHVKESVETAKEKLLNEINPLLGINQSTHASNIKNILRLLKDTTSEFENSYFHTMAQFQSQSYENLQEKHVQVKEKILGDFKESILKNGVNFSEPWMTVDLESKLEDSFNEILTNKQIFGVPSSSPEDNDNLSNKLDRLTELIQGLANENAGLKEQTVRLEDLFTSEITKLTSRNKDLEEKLTASIQDNLELKAKIESLDDAVESLNVDLVNHMDELESALNISEKSNEDLKEQVNTIQVNLESQSGSIFDILGKMSILEKSTSKYPQLMTKVEAMEKRLAALETFKTKSQEMFKSDKNSSSSLERMKEANMEFHSGVKIKLTKTDSVPVPSEKPALAKKNSITLQNGKPKVVAATMKNIPKEVVNVQVRATGQAPSTVRRAVTSRTQGPETTAGRQRSSINVRDKIKNFEDKSSSVIKKPGNSIHLKDQVTKGKESEC